MDVRKRQLVGYLTAAAVVLAITSGFGAGYATGFGTAVGSSREVPPRPLPANVCALISKDTRNRTVPWPGQAKLSGSPDGAEQISATCELATDPEAAQTYNEATLKVRVDRFGSTGMTNRTEAAQQAMDQVVDSAGKKAKKVRDLGDRAVATNKKHVKHQWAASVRVQYGDTIVSIDYATKLATGSATKAAAVTLAREVLAGLSS